jgi:hypothetical protein
MAVKTSKKVLAAGKPVKKTAAKRSPAGAVTKAKPVKKSGTCERLAKELSALIPRLDEEGLLFLIEQAQVHLYNMQVDELNRTMVRNRKRDSETPKKAAHSAIEIKGDKNSYYLVYQGKWVMFSETELLQLAKIISAPVDEYERNDALYRWLERERRDVFGTLPIAGRTDPLINKLAAALKKNIKVTYK